VRVRHQRGLGANDPLPEYSDGRLRVRPADYIATADGAILRLKLRELGLLAALANDADRVITREELLASVWHDEVSVTPRAVDAAIARLRATLSAALPDFRYIHTHSRVGYRFCPEPAEAQEAEEGAASASVGSAAPDAISASAGSGAPASAGPAGSASNL
jgi:DNA-binding response OmpR family regulator